MYYTGSKSKVIEGKLQALEKSLNRIVKTSDLSTADIQMNMALFRSINM